MYENYLWVAMLDPVELADGVDVLSVEQTGRAGRDTLEATVRPTPAYNPRCSCCALLFGTVAAGLLQAEGGPEPDDRDHDGAGFDVAIEAVAALRA